MSIATGQVSTAASSRKLFLEEILECDTILGKLLDALVQFVKGHLLLQEVPAEVCFIVDVRNFRDGVGLRS